ncbi:hypothetical protein ERHA55_51820 (plasmid) [Erwinia rhapontici]|nr:hypothetical protein ERHA55_51820 [Erwinia rhapontici]
MNERELLSAADARALSYSASLATPGCFPMLRRLPGWRVLMKRCGERVTRRADAGGCWMMPDRPPPTASNGPNYYVLLSVPHCPWPRQPSG